MVHWNRVAVALLAVLWAPGGADAAGDFGLPYSVPGFDASFRSGIGSGVVAVVKANASLAKYEASLDRSGATAVLHAVANNLTAPLNKLLGHVAASFGANGSAALQTMMGELKRLMLPTSSALEEALAAVRTLEGIVRPQLVEMLATNVTTISLEVTTLGRTWPPFSDALLRAGAPDSAVDASSVSTLVDADMVECVTSPIRLINAALADISRAFGDVAKERAAAIGHEAATNASVLNARQDLANHLAIVNRTLANTARQMEQQGNGTVRQVREGYNGLLSRLSSEPDVAHVRTFLELTKAQGQEHNRRADVLLRALSANYSRTVLAGADAIAAQLVAATAAMVDQAALSGSAFVERCLQRHTSDLRQGPCAVTRLSACYQEDGRTPNYFTSANSGFLEQLRNAAVYGNQAQPMCAQGSATCTAVYLEALEDLGQRNQARLDAFEAFLREEMGALSVRYDICARAIRTDIVAQVAMTEQKFHSCLVTGR